MTQVFAFYDLALNFEKFENIAVFCILHLTNYRTVLYDNTNHKSEDIQSFVTFQHLTLTYFATVLSRLLAQSKATDDIRRME